MSTTGFKTDLRGWNKAVTRLAREWGVEAADIMRYQFALWGQDLVRKQQPQAKDARAAIERDVRRCFLIPEHGGRIINPAPDDPAKFHQAARSTVSGKVRADFGKRGSARRLLVSERTARKVIREAQRRVGRVKAGWLPMVVKFRGRTPPGYVTRHKGLREGTAVDAMRRDGNGYLMAENRVPYADRKSRRDSLMTVTQRTRQRDLDRHMEKRNEAFCKWFNAQR